MKRTYPIQPIVSVSASIIRKGKILLIQRATEPSKGKWSLPGGVVELGETLKEAVKREVKEECSLEVEVNDIIDVRDSIVYDQNQDLKYHYVLINHQCQYLSGEPKPSWEIADIRWVDIEQVKDYPVTQGLFEIVKKAESKLLGKI